MGQRGGRHEDCGYTAVVQPPNWIKLTLIFSSLAAMVNCSGSGSVGDGGRGGLGVASGSGGSSGCGHCTGYACANNAITLNVGIDSSAGAMWLNGLTVTGDGVTMNCTISSNCSAYCVSTAHALPDGTYSLTVSSPGYATQDLDLVIATPENWGCCGGCVGTVYQNVTLVASSPAELEPCCADLENDANHCGACENECLQNDPLFEQCVDGQCSF